jgi:transposase InsO family protein
MERVCIDFVEIGADTETGKVESMTIMDDHSRFYLGAFVTTSPTTDFVIECLDKVF